MIKNIKLASMFFILDSGSHCLNHEAVHCVHGNRIGDALSIQGCHFTNRKAWSWTIYWVSC